LISEWEESLVPNHVTMEVLRNYDFQLDLSKPWREAVRAFLGTTTTP